MKTPDKLTLEVTANGYAIRMFHKGKLIATEKWKRTGAGSFRCYGSGIETKFPEFHDYCIMGSLDPSDIANQLGDFADGIHPDLDQDSK